MTPRVEFIDSMIVAAPRADLRAEPGQFFLAVAPSFDPYLPRVVFPFRMRGEFVESLILTAEVRMWTHGRAPELRGPFGKGFEVPSQQGRALILAQDGLAGAQLLALIDKLVARECEVTALCGLNDMIERWLPAEVEYRAVQDALVAAEELWDWADVVFACGSMLFYDELYRAVSRARLELQHRRAQILQRDLAMPCGTGLCYICALKTTRGVVLNCQDGPALDLADWIVGA